MYPTFLPSMPRHPRHADMPKPGLSMLSTMGYAALYHGDDKDAALAPKGLRRELRVSFVCIVPSMKSFHGLNNYFALEIEYSIVGILTYLASALTGVREALLVFSIHCFSQGEKRRPRA